MAAVIVTSTHPLPTRRPPAERPALQVLDGGRRAARAYARARDRPSAAVPGVYRRRRIGAVLAAVTLVVFGYLAVLGSARASCSPCPASGAASASAGTGAALGHGSPADYVVQPGDTLWSIARPLHPSGDLRPVVDSLDPAPVGPLVPGQRLRVDGLGG